MPNTTTTTPDTTIQEPQLILIDKEKVQEALVISILSQVTLRFKGFDFDTEKFRYKYIDVATQKEVAEIMVLDLKEITEPNPNYDNNLPTTDTNQPNITYQVGEYVFSEQWLNNFYTDSFNGSSANFSIEIFHLNAQLLQVVEYTIFVACKDNPIVTPIQGLLPLPFSAPFADIGIRSAVPQETPEGSDELSWKSGYTEPYQRPTNRDGKWIKMGQYNQILYDISKSALTLQDNLSILAGYINDEVDIKLDGVKDKLQEILDTPPANAVFLKGNQNVAGLKNFTGVNINNFKTSPRAVANLEWCSGVPIQTSNYYGKHAAPSLTITGKSGIFTISFKKGITYLNNRVVICTNLSCSCVRLGGHSLMVTLPARNKDVFLYRDFNPNIGDCAASKNKWEYSYYGN